MPALTRLTIQKPLVHKLTIDPNNAFNVLIYYEMRGGGGGAGGGARNLNALTNNDYSKGGNGKNGAKVYGQMIVSPGDSLYLCPGRGGKFGEKSVISYKGKGAGGLGIKATVNGVTYTFSGGDGGNASGSNYLTPIRPGAGGGGGGASVILLHRGSQKQIAAVAAGGGGGGGAGLGSPSTTSKYSFIGSLAPASRFEGGGAGQTHGDGATYNYRYGNFLGEYGAGAGGGGGGARGGLGGIIDFGYNTSSTPGSSGSSFSSKILSISETGLSIVTNQLDIAPPGVLDQFGGGGGVASEDDSSNGTDGDNGYIYLSMYSLNRMGLKDNLNTWIIPDSLYYKTSEKWTTIRKVFLKKGAGWNKFYDIDVYYKVEIDEEFYTYDISTEPAIAKEPPPPDPDPVPAPAAPQAASSSATSTGGGGGDKPSVVAVTGAAVTPTQATVIIATVAAAGNPDLGGGGGGGGAACPSGTSAPSATTCDTSGGGVGEGGECFTAGTLVVMADGSLKKIADVVVGDFVFNRDKTRINEVKFIEKVKDSRWEFLYSPSTDIEPFATINHPLYINGQLSAVYPESCYDLYPWLGKISKLEESMVIPAKGECVYNLWVDGDSTYIVNGYGTTSIMGSGDFLRRSTDLGFLTPEEVVEILEFFTTKGKHIQYGGYLINRILGAINNPLIDKLFSWGIKQDTWFRFFVKLFSKVLGYVMHPNR